MALSPGTRLGPYEVEDAVGAGGMGEVYRARDTRLDRTVAIKVLPGHLSTNPALRQRFDREAKAVSNLQHPSICTLYDVGHEEGVDFLVMEYLEGETLGARLEREPLPTDEMLRIAVQITEALDAAHRTGVIHRDLKPGNVMLTRTGAKLLDFGLAKMSAAEGPQSSAFTQLRTEAASGPLTEQGTILGTFQYMSPEQLEGADADARSDIFSLGAVLYEMATGKKAFEGKSQASLIAAIMRSQPQPISTFQPMTPPALDRVIRTCLEKDPRDRWQTAHDVALQLKWIREGGSEVGVPRPVAARRRGRERMAWIVAGVALVAAIGLGYLQFLRPGPEPARTVRFSIEAPKGVVSFGSPRISPDGQYIAFNGTDADGKTMIWLRPLNSLDAYPLPGTEGCYRPFWSPDSRNVGFFVGSKLKRVPIAGGPSLTLCDFEGYDGTWGKDFILFDVGAGDSIFAVPVGGGEVRAATTLDRSRGETGHGWPHFLPDGRRFLFIANVPGADEIQLGEIGRPGSKAITTGDSRVEYVHPGYLIYEREGALLAEPFDANAGKVTGDAFALTEGIGVGASGLAHFSGSATGTLIYTEGDDPQRQLLWFDRTGRELEQLGEPARYVNPALSPDGRKLAVEVRDATNPTDIWLFDLTRGVRSRFTFESWNNEPVWSPDGSRVLFASGRSGSNALHLKSVTGTGAVRQLIDRPYALYPCDWSSDGRLTVTTLRSEVGFGGATIAVDRPDSVYALPASSSGVVQPRISADGRYVAYASRETGEWQVYVMQPDGDGGKWQVSSGGGTEPQWRGDGGELFYLATDRSLMAVEVAEGDELVLGVPRRLFTAPVQRDMLTRNRYLTTPDGQRFLVVALLDRDRVPPTNVIFNWTAELQDR